MMFAAVLLLSPLPMVGNVDLPVSNPTAPKEFTAQLPDTTSPAVAPKEFTAPNSSAPGSLSEASVPSMPKAKANSDADPSFADPVAPEPRPFPFQPVKQAISHHYNNRNEKITWYSLMIAEHAGAVLDAWSTRPGHCLAITDRRPTR